MSRSKSELSSSYKSERVKVYPVCLLTILFLNKIVIRLVLQTDKIRLTDFSICWVNCFRFLHSYIGGRVLTIDTKNDNRFEITFSDSINFKNIF